MKKQSNNLSRTAWFLIAALLLQLSPVAQANPPKPVQPDISVQISVPGDLNGIPSSLEFGAGAATTSSLSGLIHDAAANGNTTVKVGYVVDDQDPNRSEVARRLTAGLAVEGQPGVELREIPVATGRLARFKNWWVGSKDAIQFATATFVLATGAKFLTVVLVPPGEAASVAFKAAVVMGVMAFSFMVVNEPWRERIRKHKYFNQKALGWWLGSDAVLEGGELVTLNSLGIVHDTLSEATVKGLLTVGRNGIYELPLDYMVIALEGYELANADPRDYPEIKARARRRMLIVAGLGEVLTTLQNLNVPHMNWTIAGISALAFTGLFAVLKGKLVVKQCGHEAFLSSYKMSEAPETLDRYWRRR